MTNILIRWAVALLAMLVGCLVFPTVLRAETFTWTSYTIQPGDSLLNLARERGVAVNDLLRHNGLQCVCDIYPGMEIELPEAWQYYTLRAEDNLLDIAQAAGVPWKDIALRNQFLLPAKLVPGLDLYIPPDTPSVSPIYLDTPAPRVEAAVRYGLSLWQVMELNSLPMPGYAVLVPEAPGLTTLPDPRLTSLALAPQPVSRGETVRLLLESTEPLTCTLRYLETVEPCYPVPTTSSSQLYYGQYIGLPALLAPGTLPVSVDLDFADASYTIPLTLRVDAGTYDYERFDLVPGGQAASNPELAAHERARIAELRTLRTPERFDSLPLDLPVDANVTSYYGSRRSYGYGFTSYHAGTDFRATVGTPIYAPANGVVILAEPLAVRGNAILIDHGQGIVTGYWHLSEIDVEEGAIVQRGEPIAKIGNTGFSTGAHLHWELWVNGLAVNPLQWVYDTALAEADLP